MIHPLCDDIIKLCCVLSFLAYYIPFCVWVVKYELLDRATDRDLQYEQWLIILCPFH